MRRALIVPLVGLVAVLSTATARAEEPQYKYQVWYLAQYDTSQDAEWRKTRNDYDTHEEAEDVADDLRQVHAVKEVRIVRVEVHPERQKASSAIVGKWAWGKDNKVTFYSDGTLVERNADGVLVSEGEWKVEDNGVIKVDHKNGYTAEVSLNTAGNRITIEVTGPNGEGWEMEAGWPH